MLKGWILYSKNKNDVSSDDYGVSRLLEAAQKRGVDLDVISPERFELVVSQSDTRTVLIDGKAVPLPDFIIPRMGSQTTYFALAVIRHLENLGVRSINSSHCIETVKDKLRVHQILAKSNLPTPKTMLLKFPVNPSLVKKEIGFPVVIKNLSGTEGKGIYLCQKEVDFSDLMDLIRLNNKNANIILQEYIKSSKGNDVRIFFIGGRPVASMKRVARKGFKSNYSIGGKVEPFEINQELEWLSTEVVRLLGLDISGVDVLLAGEGKYLICEANSSPGFKGMEEVHGKIIAEQIMDYIILTLAR